MRYFFFNDTATTEIYTLSLHDALPISRGARDLLRPVGDLVVGALRALAPLLGPVGVLDRHAHDGDRMRSEEHTSELQSRQYLVCRLLLEKKKTNLHISSIRRCHLSPIP